MRIHHVVTATLTTAALLLAGGAAPATADPQKGLSWPTSCDDGHTYQLVQQASADWNAQLDTESGSVFHLTWYEITFEVTNPDGTVAVFGPFEVVKGGNDRSHKDLLSCTFDVHLDLGDGRTAHITGPALGWLTPAGG
jgi:hypothetical protein